MTFKCRQQGNNLTLTEQQLSELFSRWLWKQDYSYVHGNTTSNLWIAFVSAADLHHSADLETYYKYVKCLKITAAKFDKYYTMLFQEVPLETCTVCYKMFCSNPVLSLLKFGAIANAACRQLKLLDQ